MYTYIYIYIYIYVCVYIYRGHQREDAAGGAGRNLPDRKDGPRVERLHVEYAERRNEDGILFIFSLFCEYSHLECVRIHVIQG